MSAAGLYLWWDQGHRRTESEWFNLRLLHCYGETGIANEVLPSTSRKGCCRTEKDAARSHSKATRAGKCALWCELYRAQSVWLIRKISALIWLQGLRIFMRNKYSIGTVPSSAYRHSKNRCLRVKLRSIYVLNSTHIFTVGMVNHQEKQRKLRRGSR